MRLVRRRKMLKSRLRDVFKPTTNIINLPMTLKLNQMHSMLVSIMTGKNEFKERFEEWSQSVQRTTDETSVVPCQEYSDNAKSQIVT